MQATNATLALGPLGALGPHWHGSATLGTSPFDPQCVPVSSVSDQGAALGIFLAVATLITPMPQLLKIWRNKSSVGFSLATMMLMISFGACNLAGTIVVKWKIMEGCHTLSNWDCFTQLLDVQQQLAAICSSLMLISLILSLPPHRSSPRRRLAVFVVLFLLFALVMSCIGASRAQPCSPYARGLATLAAAGATGFVLTAQVPQVAETWRTKGRGSLSYLYYFFNGVGCLCINVNQIVVMADPWPVWLPTTFSAMAQITVLLLGGYFLKCAKAPLGGELGPLDDEAMWGDPVRQWVGTGGRGLWAPTAREGLLPPAGIGGSPARSSAAGTEAGGAGACNGSPTRCAEPAGRGRGRSGSGAGGMRDAEAPSPMRTSLN